MKKFTTLIALILLCVTALFAQVPEKFSYQAVVRNASNALVANASVNVRVSVLQGSATGNAVFVETHAAVTNANGLMTLEIGGGSVQQGSFVGIDWANGPYFLKTEIDPAGGSNYSLTTTQQLMSVPYALYAKDAGNTFSGDYNDLTNKPTIPTVPTNVSAFTNDAGYLTGYTETDPQFNAWDKNYNDLTNKPTIPTVPANVSAFTNDAGYLTGYTETDPQFNAWDKNYNDLTNKPTIPTVPTNVSVFTNDAGYLTGYTETDPQFNAWDKDYNDLINKPTIPTNVSAFTNDAHYITAADVTAQVNADWEATEGAALILNKPQIPDVPENVSEFTNDAGYLTNADLLSIINALNARIDSLQGLINTGGHGGDTSACHDEYDFAQLPTVVTVDSVYRITQTSAQVNIVLLDDGGGVITKVGVCFDTAATPTIHNQKVGDASAYVGSQTGYYLYNLNPGVTYHARAFATNNKGTAYGEEVVFTTLIAEQTYGEPCPEAATVTDIDGNEYHTVKIGEQCWMRENLRTTHTPDGQEIRLQLGRTIPNGNMARVASVGYYYTYAAAMNGASESNTVPSEVQGICPDGWHLPSHAEWQVLMDYVRSQSEWQCGNGNYGKALAAATEWDASTEQCAFGNDILSNNKSGFTALTTYYWDCSNNYEYLDISGISTNNYNYIFTSGSASIRCLRDFVTPPIVVLNKVTKQSSRSLRVESEVTYAGVGQMIERGVCWGTEPNPTADGSHVTASGDVGVYETLLTGLVNGVTYYIRSYATNTAGTAYSEQYTYYLHENDNEPCPNVATVTDVDGNVYNTVQIGNQCWMKENLKTRRYADGTVVSENYGYPGSNQANVADYGYLYSWSAAMKLTYYSSSTPSSLQGICPIGWHVPSDAEWTELTDYVSSQGRYACDGNHLSIAKALASVSGWNTNTGVCTVGDTPDSNNTTGFSAMPAGYHSGDWYDEDTWFGQYACFWSSTLYNGDYAWYRILDYHSATVEGDYTNRSMLFSVRCLRSGGGTAQMVVPEVKTKGIQSITPTSVTMAGFVSNPEDSLTAMGFEWKVSGEDSYTVVLADEDANNVFSYTLNGLSPQTTYVYRAFASTVDTTVYGEEMTFTTPAACPNVSIVRDYDNNEYHTVLIGSQCWMVENMRARHYSDGTAISGRSYPYGTNSDTTNVQWYGYLYSSSAMLHGAMASNTNPSGVQGVCPTGWHVPSQAEWNQLTDYVSSQSQYLCSGNSDYIAKSLASSTDDWNPSTNNCAVSNDIYANNATGFSALPVHENREAWFWTTTRTSSSSYYYFSLRESYSSALYYSGSGSYSIRCLRDGGGDGEALLPSVTTLSASYLSPDSTVLRCRVTNTESQDLVVGFEWKASSAEGYEEISVSGDFNGVVSMTLSGLTPITSYEYRAFASNGDTTIYGEVMTFTTTFGACQNGATVTDVDNNTYNTIQIGDQCWMKENLRVKHYADGEPIYSWQDTSSVYPYYYTPVANDEQRYGLLYNWRATMRNSSTTDDVPSGVQGICPNGWHVPSYYEWTQMRAYIQSRSEFGCDGDNIACGKAVASDFGWKTMSSNNPDTLGCYVGYMQQLNNSTGFAAVPAGTKWFSHDNLGERACFWATSYNSQNGIYTYMRSFLIYHDDMYFYSGGYEWRVGLSVRCVRD
jgi:uncharacterized protein (TIGR02145 family)